MTCASFFAKVDSDPVRREAVRKKISGYLRHAEKLHKQHLATKVCLLAMPLKYLRVLRIDC